MALEGVNCILGKNIYTFVLLTVSTSIPRNKNNLRFKIQGHNLSGGMGSLRSILYPLSN